MGVIYHAHARFLDRKQGRVTVPAPVDPGTPNAPWWYDYIASKALAQAGFTAIMYPPVSKTQSGHPTLSPVTPGENPPLRARSSLSPSRRGSA
jgi:hypothetical protein